MAKMHTSAEEPAGAGVSVLIEVRCSSCKGNRGAALIAVVMSDGDTKWLVMNAQARPHPDRETPQGLERLSLRSIVYGSAERPPLFETAADVEAARVLFPWVVWRLDGDSLGDSCAASISCPRCAPTGTESSWYLDVREIASRFAPGVLVRLKASEVSHDDGPVTDQTLGLTPPEKWPGRRTSKGSANGG